MIAALALARRFWPIAAVVGVLIALWLYGSHQRAQGRAAGILAERAAWQPAYRAMLAQNAAVARLAAEGRAARQRVTDGLAEAQARERLNAGLVAALDAAGRAPAATGACPASAASKAAAERLL